MKTTSRPLTGSFSPALVTLVLCGQPAHAADHFVHAWDALAKAAAGKKPEAHRAFAARRLECAKADAVRRAVKPRKIKAYEAELAELEAALAA